MLLQPVLIYHLNKMMMATTDVEILELYRVSLNNAGSQPEISETLTEFGYGPDKLAEGKALLATARAAYDGSRTEKNETTAAYHAFNTKRDELAARYALDRRKAKAIFSAEPVVAERLDVADSLPRSYIRWLETVRAFYSVSRLDAGIQGRLSPLKITPEHLNEAHAMIGELEAARALYVQEVGESQNATKLKDTAFARVDDWMRKFYAVAKIALEESPQLAESLGRLVRS